MSSASAKRKVCFQPWCGEHSSAPYFIMAISSISLAHAQPVEQRAGSWGSSDSPIWKRGCRSFSSRTTCQPFSASRAAAVEPAGPPPMTSTSQVRAGWAEATLPVVTDIACITRGALLRDGFAAGRAQRDRSQSAAAVDGRQRRVAAGSHAALESRASNILQKCYHTIFCPAVGWNRHRIGLYFPAPTAVTCLNPLVLSRCAAANSAGPGLRGDARRPAREPVRTASQRFRRPRASIPGSAAWTASKTSR